jgi:hypothetical protein
MAIADALVTLMAVITLCIVLTVGEPNSHNWLLFFDFIQAFLWLVVLIVVGAGKDPGWYNALLFLLVASLVLDAFALVFRTVFLILGQGERDVLLQDVLFEILVALWVILDVLMAIMVVMLRNAIARKLSFIAHELYTRVFPGVLAYTGPFPTGTSKLQEHINGQPPGGRGRGRPKRFAKGGWNF